MILATDFTSYLGALFAVANPIGNSAIFVGLTPDKTDKEKKKLAITATIAIVIIWMIAAWGGDYVLRFFGISVYAFQTAGGLIITLLGLSMMQSNERPHEKDHTHADIKDKASIAVVPLAIPIVAGPGSLTTIIVSTHKYSSIIDKLYLSLGAIGIAALIGICLYHSGVLSKLLGKAGTKIATRLMGLILVAIAMAMLGSGLGHLFPAWIA